MEKQLQEILNTLYEAEGLLEMALRRSPEYLERLARLAREKCYHAADLASALELKEIEEAAEAEPLTAPAEAQQPEAQDLAEKLFEEKIAPIISAPEAAEEASEEPEFMPFASDEEERASLVESEESEEESEEEEEGSAEEIAAEREAEESAIVPPVPPIPPVAAMDSPQGLEQASAREAERDAEQAETIDDAQLQAAEVEAEQASPAEAEEESEAAQEMAEAAEYEESSDAGMEDEDTEESYEEEAAPAERLDFSHRRPIATFFSINDKFRFRRELFANSNPEWLSALALLETLADKQEASDYLFDDLQWDPESPDVKAFMEVLTRYYNS